MGSVLGIFRAWLFVGILQGTGCIKVQVRSNGIVGLLGVAEVHVLEYWVGLGWVGEYKSILSREE